MDLEIIILNEVSQTVKDNHLTSLICRILKRIQRNLFSEQKQTTNFENKLSRGDSCGEGWTGGLGLAYAHCGIWNIWPMRICYIAQRTLPIFCDNYVRKNLKKNECVYMYNGIILLYSRNYHNIVNQLHFHKTLK